MLYTEVIFAGRSDSELAIAMQMYADEEIDIEDPWSDTIDGGPLDKRLARAKEIVEEYKTALKKYGLLEAKTKKVPHAKASDPKPKMNKPPKKGNTSPHPMRGKFVGST